MRGEPEAFVCSIALPGEPVRVAVQYIDSISSKEIETSLDVTWNADRLVTAIAVVGRSHLDDETTPPPAVAVRLVRSLVARDAAAAAGCFDEGTILRRGDSVFRGNEVRGEIADLLAGSRKVVLKPLLRRGDFVMYSGAVDDVEVTVEMLVAGRRLVDVGIAF